MTSPLLNILNPSKLSNINMLSPLNSPMFIKRPNDLSTIGQFNYINNINIREMLINGHNAVTELDLWEYMSKPCKCYLSSNDLEIHNIKNKMKEIGYNHNDYSFEWTMRQLQFIAEHGHREYMYEFILNSMFCN